MRSCERNLFFCPSVFYASLKDAMCSSPCGAHAYVCTQHAFLLSHVYKTHTDGIYV